MDGMRKAAADGKAIGPRVETIEKVGFYTL